MSVLSRCAPLSGAVAIGLVVAGLATDQAPTSSWSDDRITAWYAVASTSPVIETAQDEASTAAWARVCSSTWS